MEETAKRKMAGERNYSTVEYHGIHEGYKCGYCKRPNTNLSHDIHAGIWAHRMTVQDYQALIDRGWRRSGHYCYKPKMDQICCPAYTIKCDALQFKISKSQKKILKKMSKFLRNEIEKDEMNSSEDQFDNIAMNIDVIPNYKEHLVQAQKNVSKMIVSSIDNVLKAKLFDSETAVENKKSKTEPELRIMESIPSSTKHTEDGSSKEKQVECVQGMDTNKPPCKKAKLLRLERKQKKLLAQGKTQKEIDAIMEENKQQCYTKTIEDLFEEIYSGTTKLETRLVRVMSDDFLDTLDTSANLYKKYQMAIHGDRPEKCDKESFVRFLVTSPLQEWTPDGGPPQGYGSFHEQYWINGELIAVGVIDVLPNCVSSVYFFYDPAYSNLSLGTFSSLREVCLTRQLNKISSNLKYYYMGFYIHSCPKMRYKARIKPSELLCPETYTWHDIERCLPKLDKQKYCRLNEDIDAIDEDGIVDIRKVWILHRRKVMTYERYKSRLPQRSTEEDEEIKEYASFVGMKCAQSLLLYRH